MRLTKPVDTLSNMMDGMYGNKLVHDALINN